ncbi:hypothetical protein [Pimelobacter sp. 30-1]|uniref:hypothetical protein n=1 Tax=Pimelobacter sp. 30-1 TaxID=2004991 RepID=UPI001C042DCC|nr:hypothetical protein [Pimelobacter sp. 30-1]
MTNDRSEDDRQRAIRAESRRLSMEAGLRDTRRLLEQRIKDSEATEGSRSLTRLALGAVSTCVEILSALIREDPTDDGERWPAPMDSVPSSIADLWSTLWNEIDRFLTDWEWSVELDDAHLTALRDAVERSRRLVQIVRAAPGVPMSPLQSDILDAAVEQALSSESAFELVLEMRTLTGRATSAADAAEEAAGRRSEVSLSDEFEKLRKNEAEAANWFRGFAIGLFVAAVLVAGWVAVASADATGTQVAKRLALGVPVLLLAGYLGREASQHLRTARWAAVKVAQLKSIRAYTGELSAGTAEALRGEFGRRVFLETPESAVGEGRGSGEAVPLDVEALVGRAVEQAVERALGGSKP